MPIDEEFSHVYVLNLDRDIWKYEILVPKLLELGIAHERFEAVDGFEIVDEFQFYKTKNLASAPGFEPHKYGLFRNSGAYGVLRSYINIFNDALVHGYETILVLQDDIYIHNDFTARFERFMSSVRKIEPDWHVLYFGASQVLWDRVQIKDGYYLPTQHTYGLFANAFSNQVYEEILTDLDKRNYQCDGVVKNVALRSRTKSFIAYPNLIIADLSRSRTMERNPGDYKKRKWILDRYDMNTKYYE